MYSNQIRKSQARNRGIFSVRITSAGLNGMKKIVKRNRRFEREVDAILKSLGRNPKVGVEMTSDLYGLRSIASNDNEFRIVYGIDDAANQVVVHAIGHRKTVYSKLARLLNRMMPYKKSGDKRR